MTDAPRVVKELRPLSLVCFSDNSEAFSAEIVRELHKANSSGPSCVPTEHQNDKDMLLLASAVLAASDREVRALRARAAGLEVRVGWWNSQLFQPATTERKVTDSDDATTEIKESSWLLRHLTLRNILGLLVVVSSAIWTVFVWYSAEKSHDIDLLNARVEMANKSRDQLESDFNFFKENAGEQGKQIAALNSKVTAVTSELATAKAKVTELTGKLSTANTQLAKAQDDIRKVQADNTKLIDALKASGKAATFPLRTIMRRPLRQYTDIHRRRIGTRVLRNQVRNRVVTGQIAPALPSVPTTLCQLANGCL